MMGHRFDLGELLYALSAEILWNGMQIGDFFGRQRTDAGNPGIRIGVMGAIRQVDHPLDLHDHPLPVEGGFAQIFDEGEGLSLIAAIEGAQGQARGDFCKFHTSRLRHALEGQCPIRPWK